MNCISDFFTYETTKSVVVKSWTIGIINRAVQLLIISYFVGWVFLHEKAYQVRDTAIESSVVTKVKGFGRYANRVMDVSDYVTPPQGTSVFVIITKMIVTENQMQGFCPESEEKFRCVSDSQCGPERFAGGGILTGRCVNYSSELRTCEIQGWCPAEVDTVEMPVMMEAENFTIFIKNSIRFPLFNFEKGNLLPDLTAADVKTCRFHPDRAPFCPILRVGDVVKFAGQDFAKLAQTGGVLGIKIGWVCDLDKAWDQCIPRYSFTRLDGVSEKSSVSPGYNFRFAKYYKMDNGSEYRTLLKAFGIRFDVLVYGDRGGGGGALWSPRSLRLRGRPGCESTSSPRPHPALRAHLRLCAPGWQVQYHPHHHQLRGGLHLGGSGHRALRHHPAELPQGGRPVQGQEVRGGERDHAEGPRLCPPRGHQRPDHGGEAVHGLRRLLYRSLGPLPQAARSAWGAQPPDGRPRTARWGRAGERLSFLLLTHRGHRQGLRLATPPPCRWVLLPRRPPTHLHPLPHPALLPRNPGWWYLAIPLPKSKR